MACRAGAAWPAALQALAARAANILQALDGRRGLFLPVAALCGHKCTAIALSCWGMSTHPLAAPPSRVVRTEEGNEWLLAIKGAAHGYVTSPCTSGKKGTRAKRSCEPRSTPRTNQTAMSTQGWAVYSPPS